MSTEIEQSTKKTVPRWAEKIRAARKRLEHNQGEFAAALGTTQSNVSKWESGSYKPSPDMFIRIATLLPDLQKFFFLEAAGIPPSYFTNEHPDLPTSVAVAIDKVVAGTMGEWDTGRPAKVGAVFVPLLADAAAAGSPRTINEKDIDQYLPLPASWLPPNATLFALKVDGDSMDPVLQHGDLVVIDVSKRNPKKLVDHMVAARIADGVTIKYLRSDGVRLMLVPQHTSLRHPIKILGDDADWGVIGEVVKCISDPPKPRRTK